ncbi:bifunctional sulfate adenylyltransferase subunit 1/adenylylsulfate kinase protein [Candidatus Omnitrophus magneticus]|uniref:Bifunctional sulfate adenylyltransferase subunit 1/adenylylsulfate kinase protein n=1 Tax=Candidatus Omnitrophus magneticus TaxID=1609969 RepID=A0A0F0CRU3_9BACT|nr:bifunctional sulfate adenylyltransferase subunit 1/adenylylsulfate kinase protein [Candidatus Omnitrophus magneticus]
MNIVVVGHVDHGKSTVIGRLLADTDSLPKGKLDMVKAICVKNAKPFEYAFLLDALKDEQTQGITIDSARCFFKTAQRDYIIIDAPGHIEFLKNMVTGASHAEGALLVIDAKEGIQENSKRHGHMLAMLGVKQVVVLVNKIDLVNYDENIFSSIERDYSNFLKGLQVVPLRFIPISAFYGDNIISKSKNTAWYEGPSVLEQLDGFSKQKGKDALSFRFPVQDIYKFTGEGDDRRIFAGTIESGKIKAGDKVIFFPSFKESVIKSIEEFNAPARSDARAGAAVGFTLTTQIYIKPGEVMAKLGEKKPETARRFKANIFWVGRAPLIKNRTYKLKTGTNKVSVKLAEIKTVLDSSLLTAFQNKTQVDRHDVAECIFETAHPVSFDVVGTIETMARFVIVDNYEISGGGIILSALSDEETILNEHIAKREILWERGFVLDIDRVREYRHRSKFIVFTSSGKLDENRVTQIAKAVEKKLFDDKFKTYYLGLPSISSGMYSDIIGSSRYEEREEEIRRLGELARILTGAGLIFITVLFDVDDYDVEKLKLLNAPNEILVINAGENNFNKFKIDLEIPQDEELEQAVSSVYSLLEKHEVILEYYL